VTTAMMIRFSSPAVHHIRAYAEATAGGLDACFFLVASSQEPAGADLRLGR
jgi:hypothetical protein